MTTPAPLPFRPKAALIDMDGVLYDSMPRHAAAWDRMMREVGIVLPRQEYFLYEGMTGPATIEMLFKRHKGRLPDADEVRRLYAMKAEYFTSQGPRVPMPGAADVLRILRQAGIRRVLVTGSAQDSLLEAIRHDFPDGFERGMRITAHDTTHGKPHPEPYLRGLEKAGVQAGEAIVIENAPLGVQSARAAGVFTIGVNTGPLPDAALLDAGANLLFPSMTALADALPALIPQH